MPPGGLHLSLVPRLQPGDEMHLRISLIFIPTILGSCHGYWGGRAARYCVPRLEPGNEKKGSSLGTRRKLYFCNARFFSAL